MKFDKYYLLKGDKEGDQNYKSTILKNFISKYGENSGYY